MARRSKASAEKRRKEVARKEKQRAKAERRAQRKLGLQVGASDEPGFAASLENNSLESNPLGSSQ